MDQTIKLDSTHIGKFMIIKVAIGISLPVQIISIGNGLCGWIVLDPDAKLRSGKTKVVAGEIITLYDTQEEVDQALVEIRNDGY